MLALLGGVVYGLQKVDDRIFGEDVAPGEEVTVRIPEGSNSDEIAHILEDAGVVESATKFEGRLVLSGDGDDFKPGTYKLRDERGLRRHRARAAAPARRPPRSRSS